MSVEAELARLVEIRRPWPVTSDRYRDLTARIDALLDRFAV